MPVVRGIVKRVAQDNYLLSSIITNIVESTPFQMRTRLEPAEGVNAVAQSLPERRDGVLNARVQ
jgi:hypothetical protein